MMAANRETREVLNIRAPTVKVTGKPGGESTHKL